MPIHYYSEDINFNLSHKRTHTRWVRDIFSYYNASFLEINYIFCSDQYLLNINKAYLNHDYYTDVITFPYHEKNDPIVSDIFISIDSVTEHSEKYNGSFKEELLRIMAHGILHLLNFCDKTCEEKNIMKKNEDVCINLF